MKKLSQWNRKYTELLKIYNKNNRKPINESLFINNEELYNWYICQQTYIKSNKLSLKNKQKILILNKESQNTDFILINTEDTINWNKYFNMILQFYIENKKLPKQSNEINELQLYLWLETQNKNLNELSENQIINLNLINSFDIKKYDWNMKYNQLLEFYNQYNRLPSRFNFINENEKQLYYWLENQKFKLNNSNYLNINQENKLKYILTISNSNFIFIKNIKQDNIDCIKDLTSWNDIYNILIKFYNKYKKLPSSISIINSNERLLFNWYLTQCYKYNYNKLPYNQYLKIKQFKELQNSNRNYKKSNNYVESDSWDENYNNLIKFKNKHKRLPSHRYSTINSEERTLINWYSNQILKLRKKELTPNQLFKLNKIYKKK